MTLSGIHYAISAPLFVAVLLGGILGPLNPKAIANVLTTVERTAQIHEEFLTDRRASLAARKNPYLGPPVAQIVDETPPPWKVKSNPWHYQIRATVFWVGERSTPGNPTPNTASSWAVSYTHLRAHETS